MTPALPYGREMRPPKYPLEPLALLREKRVDHAVGVLAEAIRGRDAAERSRLAADRKRQEHAAAAERVRSEESKALDGGRLRAADLAHAAAWEARISTEREAIASAVERARAEEVGARAGEARSLDEVASRKADARVVANDRARWDDAQRKQFEAREEEALSEAWGPSKV